MTNAAQGTAEPKIRKGALTKAVHELAVNDAKQFRSSKESRRILIDELISVGKNAASFDPDNDPKFYAEMNAISRESMGMRVSDKGLTPEEKAQLPDGVYSVELLLDNEIKSAALPPFITESGRIGKKSIRAHWQAKANEWYRSVKQSMIDRERQMALLTGGASARTKHEAELQSEALIKVHKRHAKSTEPVLSVAFVAALVTEVNRLAENHDGLEKIDTE